MIRGLFARLTADAHRGAELFGALVAIAREPHWYVEGEVPDSVDGRFAMLATVVALATARLDAGDATAREASVALTERFIEAMDVEHREMGLGDPTLGKTVRKLVGSLAKRVALWRGAAEGGDWPAATRQSVYQDPAVSAGALAHSQAALAMLWRRLEATPAAALIEGKIG
jgi:cytochrome b pre-mRNA-processing protein 3